MRLNCVSCKGSSTSTFVRLSRQRFFLLRLCGRGFFGIFTQRDCELSITPQQAFEALRVLCPELKAIERTRGNMRVSWAFVDHDAEYAKIDWPEGVDRWPMPEPKWREPLMPQDFGKKARFGDGHQWPKISLLCGKAENSDFRWLDNDGSRWSCCQVQDEPPVTFADVVAHLSKPAIDPGEGYRLLDKDEPTIEGDEYYYDGRWETACNWSSNSGRQAPSCHYRRKIEPEPLKVGDKVKIAKKVETLYWRPAMDSTVGCEGKVSEVSLHPLKHQVFVTLDRRDGWWYPVESLEKVSA
jgi:hypothetical protein